MIQTIAANDLVMLTPAEDSDTHEYAFILSGELTLESESESVKLGKNDFFSFSNLENSVLMKCDVDVTLLYVASKPTFHHVSMFISNLDELLDRIDEKDEYTKTHSLHVMDYSIAISRKMKCPADMIEKLTISALFHDVGKCCIPDEVLQKPGRLTPEERKFIYKHPLSSKDLVESNFGDEIANIVLCHHERNNGTGYPQGLDGNQIPLEAQIIAVADSFDAMTTKRPYNHPKTYEEAVLDLMETPEAYDTDAVMALKALVDSGEIYNVCVSTSTASTPV